MSESVNSQDNAVAQPCEVFLWVRGIRVSRAFYDQIQRWARPRLPRQYFGYVPVDPERLCGKHWGRLSEGEKRLAELCLEHAVTTDLLPLVPILHFTVQ